ncbi:HET-domain-containing protein [Ganoderma leucocontextum]|nr:HET-domain-containing protein [Ganoderma leucocontextum]
MPVVQALCVQRPLRSFLVAMRLLDTETGQFVEKDPEKTVYAILSHTWDTEKGEQAYEELKKIQRRYGTRSDVPQSRPRPEGGTSPSPEQDRGGPPPTPPPPSSQLPRDPSVVILTPTSSGLSTPQIQLAGTHASPADAPSSDDPPVPASGDASALPSDHPSKTPAHPIWADPELSPKIRDACAVARANGYHYIWIDSCCIDKSSSSELSEAINSMYAWYARADVCYAYLADVPPGDDHEAQGSLFRESRWFTRGWTLQELIAPVKVDFLSKDWAPIGSKHALVDLVESVTDINYKALLKLAPLGAFSVAQRLSWAATRETTRREDRAYSLLGIFGINMPTLYGEGDRAFGRLQEQIMQRTPDQSLFAWGRVYLGSQLPRNPDLTTTPTKLYASRWSHHPSPIAMSPDDFHGGGINHGSVRRIRFPASHRHEIEYTSTPYGIRTQFQMIPLTHDFPLFPLAALLHHEVELEPPEDNQWYLAILGCEHAERPGHLLGRVYCIPPSDDTSVKFVYPGYISVPSRQGDIQLDRVNLFPLSPETVEHCRPYTELKTVYMSHPTHADLPSSLRDRPYAAIRLVLLRETRDTLRSQGYSADLRDPDPAHPATHWLTLSKDSEHTITAQFQHTLDDGGRWFTINAEVKMSGSRVKQVDSDAPDESDHDQAASDPCIASWMDVKVRGWVTELAHEVVRLSVAGARTLDVDFGLDFAGTGVYILRVNVLTDVHLLVPSSDLQSALPASSAVAPVTENAREVPVGFTEDNSPSGVIDTEDEAGREEEAGGGGMASVETRSDLEAVGDETGGEGDCGGTT